MLQIDEQVQIVETMPLTALEGLVTVAERTLAHLGVVADLSIVIAPDEMVRELNAEHRGVDAVTDVLSFAAEPLPPEIDEPPYLGDLIVAYPYTIAQAVAANHHPSDEFGLLVVHGILHLVGYDHDSAISQQVMWAKQAELLTLLDIPITVPDFIHSPDD